MYEYVSMRRMVGITNFLTQALDEDAFDFRRLSNEWESSTEGRPRHQIIRKKDVVWRKNSRQA